MFWATTALVEWIDRRFVQPWYQRQLDEIERLRALREDEG